MTSAKANFNPSSSVSVSQSAASSSRLKRGAKRIRAPADPDQIPRPSKSSKSQPKSEPLIDSDEEPILRRGFVQPPRLKPEDALVAPDRRRPSPSNSRSNDNQDQGYRWWDENGDEANRGNKWTTLSHNAVIFPPEYERHGIPLFYNGQPVQLTRESEEIATFYAAKLETDYVKGETFNLNFFHDFRASLKGSPAYPIIQKLHLCDFSQIFQHLDQKKNEKKDLTMTEKKAMREVEAERCKKFTVALVDGREEKVGNFRVEPPGLFLGRGEHPKRGKVKSRIYPEDITINIGRDDGVPVCPVAGHNWGDIVHKQEVTWLCGWKDTITGGSKYVWLAAGSAFKGMSDHAKFEKARKLKNHIENIRAKYREGFKSKAKEIRQRSVAMYLIDKLALRVGNEKGDEEADTVGCCSLRVEHIQFEPPQTVVFDFLGKDSIRYFNSVEVEKPVFDSLKLFCRGKKPSDEIFHRLTVTGLNDYLKSYMDGLSAKVFRTFNASITLDNLLTKTNPKLDVLDKSVFYTQQNKEVAILCNHQRALPKAHGAQMEKLDKRESEMVDWLKELKRGQRELGKASDPAGTVEVVQFVPQKPELTDEMDEKSRAAERKRATEAPRERVVRTRKMSQLETAIKQVTERLNKIRADMHVKEELKTVALGTSKINYLDPRITVAWCKKHDVPIEKIFAKTLLTKFAWAMEVSENFRF